MVSRKRGLFGKKVSDIFVDEDRRKDMSVSIKEGSASTFMSTIVDTYITPFALALGANSVHIGFLNSFSGLFSPLAQVYGSKFKVERKKLILNTIIWQGLMIIPILLLGILFLNGFRMGTPSILIVFYSLYVIFGALVSQSWFSMIGDIVPDNERGRYFGRRNAILGTIGVIVTLLSAFLLDYYKTGGFVLIGFSILFLLAFIARFVSYYYFRKIKDPDGNQKKTGESFINFTKNLTKTNFGRFVIYIFLFNFSVMIASPFFSVYMLEELKLSYLWFTIINLSQAVSIVIFMLVWGKFADKYGNKKLLTIGSVLVPILPLLWIFNQNPFYLLIPMFLGGVGWAAFSLASNNFVYDSVEKEKRSVYLAYLNIYGGIGIFLGAGLGGLVIRDLPISFMNIFLFIFLVSAVLRGLTALIMMPILKEVRSVEKFSFSRVMPLLHLRTPGNHMSLDSLHHNMHYKKREGLGRRIGKRLMGMFVP